MQVSVEPGSLFETVARLFGSNAVVAWDRDMADAGHDLAWVDEVMWWATGAWCQGNRDHTDSWWRYDGRGCLFGH